MAKQPDKRPRHQQIAADLRAQIMSGALRVGQQLSSTAALVSQYSTANATISRALDALKEEGFIEGRPGKGVYVRARQPFVIAATAYKQPTPRGYSYDLLQVDDIEPPVEVAEAFGLTEGDRVVVRHRLLRHDGKPIELSWSYYPSSLAAGTPLARRAKIRGGAPAVLADLGLPEHEFEDRISVRHPREEEIEALGLPLDVPVIRQFRVVFSAGERPIEVSILIKGGHLFELLYRQSVLADDDSKQ